MGFLTRSAAGAGALTSRWMRAFSLAWRSASEQLQATGPQRCTWFEAACGRGEACATRPATTLLPDVLCSPHQVQACEMVRRWKARGASGHLAVRMTVLER
jgi:hypothetical protein